ncbi:hypothetical protein K501DRAFT_282405 [Backusella circina FSU 941]|nr:hypothetical protein K501DRAFT_282405 [Backusella circina FSU 941]
MSQPNYLDNVMSRFGHHLSPHQRSNISHSMVPTLKSATAGPTVFNTINTADAGKLVPGATLILSQTRDEPAQDDKMDEDKEAAN